MTRHEAAALLGVAEDAPSGDVKRRYEELYSDFHMRITNAPTAELRQTYQRNLQELLVARDTLAGQASIDADLPGRAPVRSDSPVSRPVVGPPVPPVPPVPPASDRLPPLAIGAFAAAVAFAALASLFGVLWWQGVQGRVEAERDLRAAAAAMSGVQDVVRLWTSAPLAVCNRSARSITVAAAMALYRQADGTIRTVHTGNFDWPTWELRPGSREVLSVLRGGPDDWDGAAAVYALQVGYPGKEPYLVAGLMADAKDGCVNLYLD